MKKAILIGSLCLLATVFVDCTNKKSTQDSVEAASVVEPASADSVTTDVYAGTIPCADCPGIDTTLKLFYTKKSKGDNTYELTEIYIDRDTLVSTGRFNTERGFGDDNDATVVVLNYDRPESEQQYYMHYSALPGDLHVLNPKKELIKDTTLNYILKKQ